MGLAIVENKNIAQAIRQALEEARDIVLPKKNSKVLIKPNVNTGVPYPASTNPEVVKEIIKIVFEAGARKVVVADRSWVQFFIPRFKNTVQNMRANGIFEASKTQGAEVVGFEEGKWDRVRLKGARYWKGSIRIPRMINEFDYIITIPSLKTHRITDFTLSLKNSVGILHTYDRLRLHAGYINQKTAELNLALRVNLVVIDGSKAFISGGPSKGETIASNTIIVSNSRIEADIVGYNLLRELGANLPPDPKVHPMIARAIELSIDNFEN